MNKDIIVEVKNICKNFDTTVALDSVSFSVNRGEVLGLVGENGSGKSTVTSILSGIQNADKGSMLFNSNNWNPNSMIEALECGVGMIVQESGTVPGISVAENIYLAESGEFKEIRNRLNKFGLINRKKMISSAQKALDEINASHIDASIMTGMLSIQDRKLVEIAKVMSKRPDLLIIDETTTALSQGGREIIYKLIEDMRNNNKSVIFISHDLDEITEVCDSLTVLRDGKIITHFKKEDFDEEKIKTAMIGRELEGSYYRTDYDGTTSSDVVVELKNVCYSNNVRDINLRIHSGEILGVGGLSHCGMHELGKILFGSLSPDKGKVIANGKTIKTERDAIKSNIGYVSKDRDVESLNLDASIRDNIAIAGLDLMVNQFGVITSKREIEYVKSQINLLSIKCSSMNQRVSALSGGNKQKVVFGKWIGRGSEILILDCPTRGVDVGVKQAMYRLIYEMKKEGKTIVIISEELTELIGMVDRLIVMKDGKISKELMRNENLSESDIIHYMI
ncbi:sugar ABC transporter ATP-binding protein [Erysipelothrix larvae]|uniref:Sugar ABC transporter ATP-binding protein n=1 Tax=Erysipelothrix larvae TaxID=1514105 RepID=A0A0X8H273_9FIRM|nr:sugar ABC transporter ATP-binding protein [Erysipelothrix larvae]AMC94499.1 sugar ABC transporter ATP-binding protein [Erysipelothrix larvae]